MFLSKNELQKIGFKSFGENVLISDKCSIYSPQNIEIGSNVRIDDFVILSPSTSLKIGNYVHIACYTSIIGVGEIILEDFVGISGRVSIYSSSDDYTGMSMTNPMIPNEFKKVVSGKIHIKKHSIVGTGSVVLPNVIIGMGCSIYAQTLIKSDCDDLCVYSGNPSKLIGKRLKKFLDYEKKFIGINE
jgi:acetyltransferase-like isoleucine patch superfamily enzyme